MTLLTPLIDRQLKRLAIAAAIIVAVIGLALWAWLASAEAHDLAAMSDPARDQWFRSLKVPERNTSCCDLRDGAAISPDRVRQEKDGSWSVDLGGGFIPVPPDRVVTNPPSIDGMPYVFMMGTATADSPNRIRCLVPPVPTY